MKMESACYSPYAAWMRRLMYARRLIFPIRNPSPIAAGTEYTSLSKDRATMRGLLIIYRFWYIDLTLQAKFNNLHQTNAGIFTTVQMARFIILRIPHRPDSTSHLRARTVQIVSRCGCTVFQFHLICSATTYRSLY